MTGRGAIARLAIASLLLGAAACRRKAPEVAPLPDSFARFELSVGAGAKDAGAAGSDARQPAHAGDPGPPDRFVQRVVPRELSAVIATGHAHRAVASLEAAGCDFALVLTGAAYGRFVELSYETKTPKPVDDPASPVVYCASQTTTAPPPDCAALAPIFARVAMPRRRFHVFSGYGVPQFSLGCSGLYDAKGRTVSSGRPGDRRR